MSNQTKVCTKCGEPKGFSEYYKAAKGKYGLQAICKPCLQIERDINKDHKRSRMLMRLYGINLEQYNRILSSQKHACAICDKHQDLQHRAMAVDHCHDTKKVRGLLCPSCNSGIGKLGDKAEGVRKALKYLEDNE